MRVNRHFSIFGKLSFRNSSFLFFFFREESSIAVVLEVDKDSRLETIGEEWDGESICARTRVTLENYLNEKYLDEREHWSAIVFHFCIGKHDPRV